MERSKHKCPECGLTFTAEIITDDTGERLELEYDGHRTDAGNDGGTDGLDRDGGTSNVGRTGGDAESVHGTDAARSDAGTETGNAAGPVTGKKLHPFPFDV